MDSISQSLTNVSDEWERIRLEFIAEYEAGNRPTLDTFAARYPQYTDELTDFILDYLQTENALRRLEARETEQGTVRETPAPYAVLTWEKTLASLGIPTAGILSAEAPAAVIPRAQTLTELRKAQQWSPGEAARRLALNTNLLMRLEQGRISDWSGPLGAKLKARISEVFALVQENVEEVLQATVASNQPTSLTAAFSADGDPDAAAVAKNRQAESFADALTDEIAKGGLNAEHRAFWENQA